MTGFFMVIGKMNGPKLLVGGLEGTTANSDDQSESNDKQWNDLHVEGRNDPFALILLFVLLLLKIPDVFLDGVLLVKQLLALFLIDVQHHHPFFLFYPAERSDLLNDIAKLLIALFDERAVLILHLSSEFLHLGERPLRHRATAHGDKIGTAAEHFHDVEQKRGIGVSGNGDGTPAGITLKSKHIIEHVHITEEEDHPILVL